MLVFGPSALFALATASAAPLHGVAAAAAAGDVELRGHVVCVAASGAVEPCGESPARYALESAAGLRPFSVSDVMTGMFADEQVRERELLVRAHPTPGGLETIKVYSMRAGRIHDLDYYCEVCNIVAYAPGPCPCCRQPLVLRETPMP